MDRRDVASWLGGPGAQRPETAGDHPGKRLGMPGSGPGSIARFGRRLVAVFIDWTMCQILAFGLFHVPFGQGGPGSWVPLGLFALENVLLVGTIGSTFGQRVLGMGLISMNGGRATVVQVLLAPSCSASRYRPSSGTGTGAGCTTRAPAPSSCGCPDRCPVEH